MEHPGDRVVINVESSQEHFATKADIEEMFANIAVQVAELRGEFRGIKWALVASIALAGIGVGIVAFASR